MSDLINKNPDKTIKAFLLAHTEQRLYLGSHLNKAMASVSFIESRLSEKKAFTQTPDFFKGDYHKHGRSFPESPKIVHTFS